MFAQSFVETGVVDWILAGLQSLWQLFRDWIPSAIDSEVLLWAGVILALSWFLVRLRSSRIL
jgi:hypothetical protein